MARVNVEECWWSDPRRMTLLLAIGFEADSAAVNMWRSAQEFWGKGRGLVPYEVFFKLKHAQVLVDAGLADIRGRSVYVRGSSEFLEWHAQKREQASLAGKKSAESRRKKNGSAQPKGGKGSQISEREPNENRTDSNKTEPSVSDSDSGSDSPALSLVPAAPGAARTNSFIAAYCRKFKDKWGVNPAPVKGKNLGAAKRLAEGLPTEKSELYLDAFFAIPDAYLKKSKHPLALLEHKLNEILVFAESGQFTTYKAAQQSDQTATNAQLLRQVQSGEL